jgi:ATP-binding cassette subfamily B protein
VREATRILVFQNGRIVETGTFDELNERGGFFAELVQAQFGPATPLPAAQGEVERSA